MDLLDYKSIDCNEKVSSCWKYAYKIYRCLTKIKEIA